MHKGTMQTSFRIDRDSKNHELLGNREGTIVEPGKPSGGEIKCRRATLLTKEKLYVAIWTIIWLIQFI